jgi:hypothetical protein
MTSPSVPATPSLVQDLQDASFQQAAVQAAATMQKPEYNGRLQKAMDFVLTHAVTLHEDGTATVKSGSHTYHLALGCTCQDSQNRSLYCKHYLAVQLLKRTYERLYQPVKGHGHLAQEPAQKAPQDVWHYAQAPCACTLKWSLNGIELLLTLRDTTDDALFSRLKRVLPRIAEKVQAQKQTGQESPEQAQGVPEISQDNAPYCHSHSVPLKKYSREGRSWLSHYDGATNAWCRGK